MYQRDDVVVDVVVGVEVQQLGDGADTSLPHDSLVMCAQVLEEWQHQSMLVAEHGTN